MGENSNNANKFGSNLRRFLWENRVSKCCDITIRLKINMNNKPFVTSPYFGPEMQRL